MTRHYTENLADFGSREIALLRDILNAWVDDGLPDGFYSENIRPAMNMNSGYVFLVNDDYQVAMMNGDTLEIFHTLPYSGHEGFIEDLVSEIDVDDLHPEDREYLDSHRAETEEQPSPDYPIPSPLQDWKQP